MKSAVVAILIAGLLSFSTAPAAKNFCSDAVRQTLVLAAKDKAKPELYVWTEPQTAQEKQVLFTSEPITSSELLSQVTGQLDPVQGFTPTRSLRIWARASLTMYLIGAGGLGLVSLGTYAQVPEAIGVGGVVLVLISIKAVGDIVGGITGSHQAAQYIDKILDEQLMKNPEQNLVVIQSGEMDSLVKKRLKAFGFRRFK